MRLTGERKRVSLKRAAPGSFPALIQCETMHHRLCSRRHTSRLPINSQRSEVAEIQGKDHHFQAKHRASPEKSGSQSLWMNGHFTLVGFSRWFCQGHSLCYDISARSWDSGTKAKCTTNPVLIFAQKHVLLTEWLRAFEQILHSFSLYRIFTSFV